MSSKRRIGVASDSHSLSVHRKKRSTSCKELLHPRHIFINNRPDFVVLCESYPLLKEYVDNYGSINWENAVAIREILYVLLKDNFNLDLEIPCDKLIPRLPLRLNYIHFIEDLMLLRDSTITSPSLESSNHIKKLGKLQGVDIGTGSSAIYPLLVSRLHGWRMLASDISLSSVESARTNVLNNRLDSLITIKLVSDETVLGPLQQALIGYDESIRIDFCMCNPPFFSTSSERESLGRGSASAGTTGEAIISGGEVAFVKRIVSDSLVLRDRVRWYTSMLGRKVDIEPITLALADAHVTNVRLTELSQGRTHRWVVAWSFLDEGRGITIHDGGLCKLARPELPNQFTVSCGIGSDRQRKEAILFLYVIELFKGLDLDISINHDLCRINAEAYRDSWTNARRYRREKKHSQGKEAFVCREETPLFSFTMNLWNSSDDNSSVDFKNITGNEELFRNFFSYVRVRTLDYVAKQFRGTETKEGISLS